MKFLAFFVLTACVASVPTTPTPKTLDPSGTWGMSFSYAPATSCQPETPLPESWIVIQGPAITSVVFNGFAVQASADVSSDCSPTDCSFAMSISWPLAQLDTLFVQRGAWTLRDDGSIDGYGTITTSDTGNPSNICETSFTVKGQKS